MTKHSLVAIGGGNGTTQVILASKTYFSELTAIVGTTDCGRSTGVARAIGRIPAPGDVRNTIAHLAIDQNELFVKLLQHRFNGDGVPQLEGMAVGNLLLAALSQMTGNFTQAVDELQSLVGCIAQIIPVSDCNTDLCAELEDGTTTHNELETRGLNKSPIKRLFLSQSPAIASEEAIQAILNAELIVIGPGSFYTSLLATLLFEGVRDALKETKGKVVYICNTTTQPGQTDTFSSYDHVACMNSFLGEGVLDFALVNKSEQLSDERVAKYAKDGVHVLHPDDSEIMRLNDIGLNIIVDDFAESASEKRELWNKLDTVRHDREKIGEALYRLV